MERTEIEQVLANWITQANSPFGTLTPGDDPAQWAARQFLRWWYHRTEGDLSDAISAVRNATQKLERLGGWSNMDLGEAMHELIHARNALNALDAMFRLPGDSRNTEKE